MQLKNVTLNFGKQTIFDDINLTIDDNSKVGIVGLNGAGKSTFFNVLMSKQTLDYGKVITNKNCRIKLLPQVIDSSILKSDLTVFDYLLEGRPVAKLQENLNILYEKLTSDLKEAEQNKILKEISDITTELDYWDVYNCENILLKIIDGMHIEENLLEKKMHELSGGQKSKVSFARLLYSSPEIVLLDEPTNHLDEESKEYIISYLKNYNGSVLIISHDIEFLNQVTDETLYLDKRTHKMILHKGNYEKFLKYQEAHEAGIQNEIEAQERQIKELRDIVLLYTNSSGKRKRMAQSREKQLDKLISNKIEAPPVTKTMNLKLEIDHESSATPLKVNNVSFSYDKTKEDIITDDLSFNLSRGEKFLIVGKNGIGKSTLLKLIVGSLKPDKGNIELGYNTEIGYYAQEHELLDEDKNIIDNFSSLGLSEKSLRSVLGRFLFSSDEVYKNISVLSPGERSRVALAKLSLLKANFLILDEPTNHLDPQTQEIIASTFKTYPGTMLVVSHNTHFVDNLGIDRILILPSGKIVPYDLKIVEHYEFENSKK
ncbi:MAG: ABC-F family ATP-binding cassette domain-containing protein [Bacilli bacterium]